VDPRDGLDDLEKRKFLTLLGLELRSLRAIIIIIIIVIIIIQNGFLCAIPYL
jgi:hypothetical protein